MGCVEFYKPTNPECSLCVADTRMTQQPILVLLDKTSYNRFSAYLLEILDVEGFFSRDVKDLSFSDLSGHELKGYDIVLLTHMDLTSEQKDLLRDYVETGGNLIVLRPPRDMAALFGLEASMGINKRVDDRYIKIEEGHPLGRDVAAEILQFHGDADLYTSVGADVLAYISGDFHSRTVYPAVSTFSLGDGHTAAFAYDLAASTVLLHQGRCENSSVGSNPDADRDDRWIPNDLFIGHLDARLKYVPQADIHQDLLVRIINWMSRSKRPIPRIWYFPNAAPGMAYFNGDSDGMSREDYLNIISTVKKYEGKYTVYLMEQHHKIIEPVFESALRAEGHSFGQHIFLDWRVGVDEAKTRVAQELKQFQERYGHPPLTNRGHCLIWVGWTEMAKFLSAGGVRMDQNFIPRRYYRHGYLNGSGLPVKFMDEAGILLDIYEQNTHITDDGSIDDQKFLVPGYSQKEVTQTAVDMLDDCVDRYHGVFQAAFHPHMTTGSAMWLLEALLAHCWERSIPMVGGDEWVRLNDARREIVIRDITYDAETGRATFAISGKTAVEGLTWMLPAQYDGRLLESIRVDKKEVHWTQNRLKGTAYGLCAMDISEDGSSAVEVHYNLS